jgi:acetyltransferase-like isoleucine patch superfamily enzyme
MEALERRFARAAGKLLAAFLLRIGKTYRPAEQLPAGLVAHVLFRRVLWLGRGSVRFRRLVFVASRVHVRGKGGIRLGRGCTLEREVVVDGYARNGVRIGKRSKIGAYTIISCTSHLSVFGKGFEIGSDSGIGEFSYIGAAGGVQIGDNVIMGQYVSFHSQEHVLPRTDTLMRLQGTQEKGISVGSDCWIGARVTLLDGARVGNGCVVAAGTVVRDEFPPYSVIAGVPGKVVRMRGTQPER